MSGIGKVRKEIGANVRSLRKQAGLTQEGLSERADLHPVYVSQIERGAKAVSIEALCSISKALEVPLMEFFRGVGDAGDGRKS